MPAAQPRDKRQYIQAKHTRFTADSARRFDRHSATNAAAVRGALTCDCEPYIDVFTLRRWNPQGYRVKKGQKAHRVPVKRSRPYTLEADPDTVRYASILTTAHVFCRHQVEPIAVKSKPRR